MAQSAEDKKQIGLTPEGSAALTVLMKDGRFTTESDAYRFGISYAIAKGLEPEQAPDSSYGTKFNATGGLDADGRIRDLLLVLDAGDPTRPYATAERLAELGITAVAKRLQNHESLAEVLCDNNDGADDYS